MTPELFRLWFQMDASQQLLLGVELQASSLQLLTVLIEHNDGLLLHKVCIYFICVLSSYFKEWHLCCEKYQLLTDYSVSDVKW